MKHTVGHWLQWIAGMAVMASSLSTASAALVLRVAAASDLATCIDAINADFAKSPGGIPVKSSVGASGNLFAQIKNGAPFDVFLSADTDYPYALAKAGLADAVTLTIYAHGQLVLWVSDARLDAAQGMGVLTDARITRIAIANPEIAPYGRAAKAALQHVGIWDAVKPKLVFGENVAQAAQFVQTGNAQAGLVGSAHVKTAGIGSKGSVWQVPPAYHPLMEQGGIAIGKQRANPAALKYLAFLSSDAGRAILRTCGFALPQVRR